MKWNDVKDSFQTHENFDKLVSSLRQLKGARKLVIIAHGWSMARDTKECTENWVSDMATSVMENDPEPTATIALCWNSFRLPPSTKQTAFKSGSKTGVGKLCLKR